MKLEKKRINQNFIPLLSDEIIVDSVIPFDIYIKKSHGYVIILEAGTSITPALKAKLSDIGKLYVPKTMLSAYTQYSKEYQNEDEFTIVAKSSKLDKSTDKSCRELRRFLAGEVSYKEKVEAILSCGYALMRACFKADENQIFLEHIEIYTKVLVYVVSMSGIKIKQLVALMKDENCDEVHAVNVALLALYLAKDLDFSDDELACVFKAGLFHDLGNKLIDYEILNAHGKLSAEQFKTIQEHPRFGADMVKEGGIDNVNIYEAILYHHENLDGSGYPMGLKGRKIPKNAQVIALCDVFNALTMERSYRGSYSSFNALKIIKLEMKRQVNPLYTNKLIKMLH